MAHWSVGVLGCWNVGFRMMQNAWVSNTINPIRHYPNTPSHDSGWSP